MYRLTSQLILYSDLPRDEILVRLADLWRDFDSGRAEKPKLIHRLFSQVKRILDISTTYGFDENLWQNYLTFVMVTHPNSFSLTCEQRGASDGSINGIARHDLQIFRQLFDFDFSALEEALGVDCLTTLTHYRAIPKDKKQYSHHVSQCIRSLSARFARTQDPDELFALVTEHFRLHGTGLFGMNHAFRVQEQRDGSVEFLPIHNLDAVTLNDLIGYELQKQQLRENLSAFVSGKPYNNTLLYGDAGTGKSTSVKAALNEYAPDGLRIIELYKHQFHLLSTVIAQIKNRRYHFILFLDDLSFDEDEADYKYLKAVIEGGLESRPDNVMILATSNRRHLIKETWADRSDMEHDGDIHRSDTVEEKLSLSARFGCSIRYAAPDKRLFEEIVRALAARCGTLPLSEEELLREANRWELRHGGLSGRTAQQFINALAGKYQS